MKANRRDATGILSLYGPQIRSRFFHQLGLIEPCKPNDPRCFLHEGHAVVILKAIHAVWPPLTPRVDQPQHRYILGVAHHDRELRVAARNVAWLGNV